MLQQTIIDLSKSINSQLNQEEHFYPGQYDLKKNQMEVTINEYASHLNKEELHRVQDEFFSSGPLESLIQNEDITEIMICSRDEIWYEEKGAIRKHDDLFYTDLTFSNFIHKLSDETQAQTTANHPFANGYWRGFRVHLISPPITQNFILTLRRIKNIPLSLEQLSERGWCDDHQLEKIKNIIQQKKNLLVIGNTGSGKTTLLNALLKECDQDRIVVIEDTSEIHVANSFSPKMLTRKDANDHLTDITQTDLVKQSLRMRPDRLVIGEIRGNEAKDLLMALSTGHEGSMGTIHAQSPNEALIRLEMLVQMGAPQWSLDAIRKLIHLCIHYLIVTKKEKGRWYLEGIYRISGQEAFGFLLDEI